MVELQELPGRDLGYIDFLVPGMVALTIMQLGIFSVSFGFVQLKRTGALRRLFATPTSPTYFLGAQVTSRLIIGEAQVLILLGVGLWFGLQLVGSVALLLAVAALGSIVFLAMGFGVAGWAKNEDQAAPVAEPDQPAHDLPVGRLLSARGDAGRPAAHHRLPAVDLPGRCAAQDHQRRRRRGRHQRRTCWA